jgi:long-chain fatty acid transport protein
MRNLLIITVLCLLAGRSRGGGFELSEVSPQGMATVGAQAAVAEDAAAVFYNPAGMAYQPGFGALAGGYIIYTTSTARSGSEDVSPNHTTAVPSLFVTQRLGKHFAVGLGSFVNFGQQLKYPDNWNGRFLGQFVNLTTATINPAIAYRPLPYLSFGGGLDIVIGSLDIYQAVNFGGGEGQAHAGLTGVGVGGNAGVLVDVYKQYLRFGFTYRSRVDIHFDGNSSINAPPEVQSMVSGLFDAVATLPLPHNFSFALASRPTDRMTLSADVHYTLWSDISTVTLDQTSLQRPGMTVQNNVNLGLQDSWGVRAGFEYRVLQDNRLRLRAGGGWDQTAVPRAVLGPLLPDGGRVVAGAGLGYFGTRFSVEAGYLVAVSLPVTSENPELRATYSGVGHLISLAATIRFADVGGRFAANNPQWSNGAQPPREMGRITAQNVR